MSTRMTAIVLAMLPGVFPTAALADWYPPEAECCATVRVLHAVTTQAVSGAEVSMYYAQGSNTTGVVAMGSTDSAGYFASTGTACGMAWATARKSGYYMGFASMVSTNAGPWSTNLLIALRPLGYASITVVVTNEAGEPVVGAEVGVGFEQHFKPTEGPEIRGLTDSNGQFTAVAQTSGLFGIGVRKAGYYETSYWGGLPLGRPETWTNTFHFFLRGGGNSIAMYAKRVRSPIPATNAWCGFDLVVGDWVQPYGQGVTNDFLFIRQGTKYATGHDTTNTLTFANATDGLVPVFSSERGGIHSALRLPAEAPNSGYQTSRVWRVKHTGKYVESINDYNNDMCYFIRVRTATNAQGQLTAGHYGKVYDDLRPGHFTYFLNPSPTNRNVEFDPNRNLFPDRGGRGAISVP